MRRSSIVSLIAAGVALVAFAWAASAFRGSATAAIEGFPDEMRALARARAADPNDRRTVRELPRFLALPHDAQLAALATCHMSGGPAVRPNDSSRRDCLFDDADDVERVLENRRERRERGWLASATGVAAGTIAVGFARRARRPFG